MHFHAKRSLVSTIILCLGIYGGSQIGSTGIARSLVLWIQQIRAVVAVRLHVPYTEPPFIYGHPDTYPTVPESTTMKTESSVLTSRSLCPMLPAPSIPLPPSGMLLPSTLLPLTNLFRFCLSPVKVGLFQPVT